MGVALSCRTPRGAPWRAYLRARARRLLHALALGRYELSLVLVDDAEMRALNRTYRGVDRATDVLAFPLREEAPGDLAWGAYRRAGVAMRPRDGVAARLLGDVVISIDTAAAQAHAGHAPLGARLDVLLIHGMLHLLGYDHEVSAAEARRMARRARALRVVLAAESSLAARFGARTSPAARPGARSRPAARSRIAR
jgi:probable rRNA maturation factor